MTDHQKSRAESKKLRCCAAWTVSLVSVASNKAGICQVQSTMACISQAIRGLVMNVQTPCHQLTEVQRTRSRAQPCGRPFSIPTSGLPSTKSGAATSMSTSCWLMCAENNIPPHLCRGEINAITRPNQPDQKHAASQRRRPWPTPAERQIRTIPSEYQYADSASGKITSGSNSH